MQNGKFLRGVANIKSSLYCVLTYGEFTVITSPCGEFPDTHILYYLNLSN